jgi:hypothetical protein
MRITLKENGGGALARQRLSDPGHWPWAFVGFFGLYIPCLSASDGEEWKVPFRFAP